MCVHCELVSLIIIWIALNKLRKRHKIEWHNKLFASICVLFLANQHKFDRVTVSIQSPATYALSLLFATEVSNCHRIERCESTHTQCRGILNDERWDKRDTRKNRNINQNTHNTRFRIRKSIQRTKRQHKEHDQRNVITKHLNHYVKLRIHVVFFILDQPLRYCCCRRFSFAWQFQINHRYVSIFLSGTKSNNLTAYFLLREFYFFL